MTNSTSVLIIGLECLTKMSLADSKNINKEWFTSSLPNANFNQVILGALEKAEWDMHIIGCCQKKQHNNVRIWLQKNFDLARYPKHVLCQFCDDSKKQEHSLQMVEAINNVLDQNSNIQKIAIYTADVFVAEFFSRKFGSRAGMIWNVFMPDSDHKPVVFKASYTV